MQLSHKYRSTFVGVAFIVIFLISNTRCEDTALKTTLATLSTIISWLPEASIPTAPLRLISVLLQLLMKQLQTTLIILDENGAASKINASSTMTIRNNSRNWYHPEAQLGRCMFRYVKTEYPEIMNKLKMDTIAGIIDVMVQNGDSLFGEKIENKKEIVTSEMKHQIHSNEIGYTSRVSASQPVISMPMPMLPYSRSGPRTIPGSHNYMNYNMNYNARPSFVVMRNNQIVQDHINRRINPYHHKEAVIDIEKESSGLSRTKNILQNHKMDIESNDQIAGKSRTLNNRDSSVMHVGSRQFSPFGDAMLQINASPSSDTTGKSNINENFKIILLEGFGIDPKNVKKWTPVYCGMEYVIDILQRAEQMNLF